MIWRRFTPVSYTHLDVYKRQVVDGLRSLATIPPVLNEYKRRSVARAAKATWDVNVDALEEVLKN